MWLVVLLLVLGSVVLILQRTVDRETRGNLKFLGKIAAALAVAMALLGLLLATR